MSIEALSWVLRSDIPTDSTETLVLLGLANHAQSDGTSAWPAQDVLAKYARTTSRTVRRKLSSLEESGLIRRGDQRIVEHIRADHRPVVWDLLMNDRTLCPAVDDRTSASVREGARQDTSVRGISPTAGHPGSNDRTPVTERPDTGVLQTVINHQGTGGADGDSRPRTSKRRAPSTPIPDGWTPLDRHREKAATEFIDIEKEAEKFVSDALAKDKRFVNWDRAFDTWLSRDWVTKLPNKKPFKLEDWK